LGLLDLLETKIRSNLSLFSFLGWLVLLLVCFLVLEEDRAPLTHNLPADLALQCVLASAPASSCRLIVAFSASRTAKSF
jgi:hypothetical protein